MPRHTLALTAAILTGAVASAQPLPFVDDFNADTSANYLQLAEDDFNTLPGTEDVSVTFAFEFSTFVDGSEGQTIPPAPRTTDGSQIALRLAANVSDDNGGSSEGAAVNLFPLVEGSPLVISAETSWRMSMDMWANMGAGGTTEFTLFGAHMSGTLVNWHISREGSDGIACAITGDGGAGEDYVLLVGQGLGSPPESNDTPQGTLEPDAVGFINGEDNNLQPLYQELFPQTDGAPTEQWVKVDIIVVENTLHWFLNGTLILRHDILDFSTFTSGSPMIGHSDRFSSVNTEPEDQFVLIDNLVIEEFEATRAGALLR